MGNLSRIKTSTLEKRMMNLTYNLELYPEMIATYKGKTNNDLDGGDRFILNVAVTEKEIKNFNIEDLVAKWENDLVEISKMYDEYKAELEKRNSKQEKETIIENGKLF